MRRLVVSLLLASALGDRAFALVLCQTRDHQLFARTACRKKESALSLTGIGVVGSTGIQGAVGPQGPATLRLVDASGREVGPVTDTGANLLFADASAAVTSVLLKSPPIGQPLLLGIDLAGNPTGLVRYQSSDCTGTPLLPGPTFLAVASVVGETVFYPSASTSATMGHSVETTDRSHGCTTITARGGCCRMEMISLTGYQTAATTTLGALGITPPLHAITGSP